MRLDWLDSRHTFSFGGYFDSQHVGFRSLRVLNDDRVKSGADPRNALRLVAFNYASGGLFTVHRDVAVRLGHPDEKSAARRRRAR